MIVTATQDACRCEWRYVSTVKSRSYVLQQGPALKVLPGADNRTLMPA